MIHAKGSITRAARLLGWDYHGTLQSMLDEGGRHNDLSHLRTPPEKRKKSIVGVSRAKRRRGKRRLIKILHVEDYKLIADAVRDTLEALGWKVETCADGTEVMKILAGDEPYNVLIFDYDLPGHSGVELTRRARAPTSPTNSHHHVLGRQHRTGRLARRRECGSAKTRGHRPPFRNGHAPPEQRHDRQAMNAARHSNRMYPRRTRLPLARSLYMAGVEPARA